MRRSFIVIVALAALTVSACASGAKISTSDTKASTSEETATTEVGSDVDREAIIDSLVSGSGLGITDMSAECFADAVAGELSPDGMSVITESTWALADLSSDDAALVIDALDGCVSFEEIQGSFVDEMAGALEIAELSDVEISCVGRALESEYGGVGSMLDAIENQDETDFALAQAGLFGGCLNTETVTGFVTDAFSAQMEPAAAQCLAEALVSEFGGGRLFEMFAGVGLSGTDELPADLEAAITRAIPLCSSLSGATGGGSGGDVGSGIGQ